MSLTFFKNLFSSRLLLPVFVLLILAAAAQLFLSQWLIRSQVAALTESVETAMEAGQQRVGGKFSEASADVAERLVAMSDQASLELGRQLESQLNERQQQIAGNLKRAVIAEAQGLADAMAAVAAPLIWDRDTPKLTGLVELMDSREAVLFAVYFDQYGERMTRYVDRTDARVKTLMDAGEGRGAITKVLDAASRDPEVVVITADIAPQGSVVGKLKLGLSTLAIARDMQQLEERFGVTVRESSAAVSSVLASQTGEVSERLQRQLADIETSTRNEIGATIERIESQTSELSGTLSFFSVLTNVLLLLLIAVVLGVGVLAKVNRLNLAIWGIARGEADLKQRVNLSGNDELTHMASGVNEFIGRIQAMISRVNLAAGTASTQAQAQSQASSQAVVAVNSQREEIDQVSATVNEMSGSIQEVAENIQQVAESVRTINSESEATAEISRQARNELDLMVAEVDAAVAVVTELNQRSEEIGSVLAVIGSIAAQTNLLALNAAIEAARAGESGRGFAVVADEVRTLASRTQKSTTEIQAIIDRLQAGSQKAVETIGGASERVVAATGQFRLADEHFEKISALLAQLQERSVTISAAAEEQSTQARQISDNVTDMARAAESTVDAIRLSDRSSTEIRSAIGELRSAAQQFSV
ncbi:methyl-accepting chemotaxis protein [Marinobacter salicampi]|uniref:methyl-accepting chemotaxis protein n=1 Tax=Marinobacter salicampi TaxID=435907 RepID=UPI0014072695|nr:methyl-accepting chemotaxis protein [Marinobacter salicampi]